MPYGLYSNTQGADGNGVFNPSDPALGGHNGSVLTAAASGAVALCSGGFVPQDQVTTVVTAIVQHKTPQSGLPTAAGSFSLKGTFIRNGNTVTQVGNGNSESAEIAVALQPSSARLIVDTSL